ncbi:MAG: ChaN family lipoprotein, partial [Fimbriimonadales bacterium]|nr:ChaN family lipoprotein [Fimbriimonadales bacterium]
ERRQRKANLASMIRQREPSPYNLEIGDAARRARRLRVQPGDLIETGRGRKLTLKQLTQAVEPCAFLLIGEEHSEARHHQFQAAVIDALVQAGRSVIVGMEMFDRTKQHPLNLWTLNRLNEAEFIEQSDWQRQWGFDFALYRPIFEVVYRHRLRLVALNVPRALVRQVASKGWASLSEAERLGIAQLDLSQTEHRQLFNALMSGHPGMEQAGHAGHANPAHERFYEAQVLWDTAMADSALRYLERTVPSPRLIFVILAGNGHVMYDVGISLRLRQRTNLPIATVVCLPVGEQPMEIRASLADFVWMPGRGEFIPS